jgi:hypothetical protein
VVESEVVLADLEFFFHRPTMNISGVKMTVNVMPIRFGCTKVPTAMPMPAPTQAPSTRTASGWRPYLPREWADDAEHRSRAKVPDEVAFKTKPQLAADILTDLHVAGLLPAWATGDEVYGRDSALRGFCEHHEVGYVFGVPCSFTITLTCGRKVRADQAGGDQGVPPCGGQGGVHDVDRIGHPARAADVLALHPGGVPPPRVVLCQPSDQAADLVVDRWPALRGWVQWRRSSRRCQASSLAGVEFLAVRSRPNTVSAVAYICQVQADYQGWSMAARWARTLSVSGMPRSV